MVNKNSEEFIFPKSLVHIQVHTGRGRLHHTPCCITRIVVPYLWFSSITWDSNFVNKN